MNTQNNKDTANNTNEQHDFRSGEGSVYLTYKSMTEQEKQMINSAVNRELHEQVSSTEALAKAIVLSIVLIVVAFILIVAVS
jgi:hypothetical protein